MENNKNLLAITNGDDDRIFEHNIHNGILHGQQEGVAEVINLLIAGTMCKHSTYTAYVYERW